MIIPPSCRTFPVLVALCSSLLLLSAAGGEVWANPKQKGGGGGNNAAAIAAGVGLILQAAQAAEAAERAKKQKRVDRRVSKRKELQDDASEAREKAVTKIREAKEAKKARAARPPRDLPFDEQIVEDFNEDHAQKERADAAREALADYQRKAAKLRWWDAEAALAGDLPDVKKKIFDDAVAKAAADRAAREANQKADYERDREEYNRKEAERVAALRQRDAKIESRAKAFHENEQSKAEAKIIEGYDNGFGSTKGTEARRADEAAKAEAEKARQRREQAQKLIESAGKATGKGGLAQDAASGIANTTGATIQKQEAIDAISKE